MRRCGQKRDPPLVDARPDETEDRGQDEDSNDHGEGDHDGPRRTHVGHERNPRRPEPEQRDDDCEPGKHDRTSGRRLRPHDRIFRAKAPREPLPEARDDQQRVVDADADADHRRELSRHGRNVEIGRADADQEEAGHQRQQRDENRKTHRHNGAEGDHQDNHGGADADQFRLAQAPALGGSRYRTAGLHLQIRRRALGAEVQERVEARLLHILRALLILDRHPGDRTVGRDRARLFIRRNRAEDVRQSVHLRHQRIDLHADFGVVDSLRRSYNNRGGVSRRRGKALVQQVDQALRFGTGQGETICELASETREQRPKNYHQDERSYEDSPRMTRSHARPSFKEE